MRPIDADALIEKCGGWHVDECTESGFIGTLENLLATEPTIQPQSTTGQLNDGARSTAQSNDLIDRQAAIDALQEEIDKGIPPFDDVIASIRCGVRLTRNIIEDLPSAQPEPQWIPVSERLPETEEFVLASLTGKYRNITFEHACEIADYADGEWCVYAYPHMSAEKCEELIEAWMPLPEAYKPNK